MSWQGGVYFFHEDYTVESFSYDSLTTGSPQDGYLRSRQKNDALAVFGAVNYAVTQEFKVRGGLRYTHDKKDFSTEDYNSAVFGTLPDLAALAAAGPLAASPKDNKTNWDLSGTYALDKSTNLYARVATGFRASSVQGASAFNNQSVAKPENNTSYEAGVKADLFDGRARINFGVFYYEVKDLQLTAVGGAANANILLNAKKASGQGFELDAQAYLTDQLLATLGVGYADTKIKDPDLAVAVCAQCTVTDPRTAGGQALIDGNPLPQAPKTTVNFTLRYSQPLPSGGRVVHLHRLGLPQQDQLLPLRVGRVHRQAAHRRRPAPRLPVGQRQVRGGGLRAQHRRRGPRGRRHRLQQPDRLHQRAAHLRGSVQGGVLRPVAPWRFAPDPRGAVSRLGAVRCRLQRRGSRLRPASAPLRRGTNGALPRVPWRSARRA